MLAHRFFPLTNFEDLRGEVERVFGVCTPTSGLCFPRARAFPAVNAWENEDSIFVEAEVPGMKMEDLEVEVLGRDLCIKGSRTEERSEDTNYHRQERVYGEFTRHLTLDTDVDAEGVKAALKDGVLTITLPKAASAKARKITVTTE